MYLFYTKTLFVLLVATSKRIFHLCSFEAQLEQCQLLTRLLIVSNVKRQITPLPACFIFGLYSILDQSCLSVQNKDFKF